MCTVRRLRPYTSRRNRPATGPQPAPPPISEIMVFRGAGLRDSPPPLTRLGATCRSGERRLLRVVPSWWVVGGSVRPRIVWESGVVSGRSIPYPDSFDCRATSGVRRI